MIEAVELIKNTKLQLLSYADYPKARNRHDRLSGLIRTSFIGLEILLWGLAMALTSIHCLTDDIWSVHDDFEV